MRKEIVAFLVPALSWAILTLALSLTGCVSMPKLVYDSYELDPETGFMLHKTSQEEVHWLCSDATHWDNGDWIRWNDPYPAACANSETKIIHYFDPKHLEHEKCHARGILSPKECEEQHP